MSSEFLAAFQEIKGKHDEAFKVIDQAIRFEENEEPLKALEGYKTGIEVLDEALAIPVRLPENIGTIQAQWNEACTMVHKMKRARAEVLQRIGILSEKYSRKELNTEKENDETSSQAEAATSRPRTYSELAQVLRNLQSAEPPGDTLDLLFTCDGVKLYHIKANGTVTTTSDDSTLRVLRLGGDESRNINATYFMQIIKTSNAVPIRPTKYDNEALSGTEYVSSQSGTQKGATVDNFDARQESSWIYPLVPGVSPCFRTEYGAFIFPDLESSEPGSSFGIMMPEEDGLDKLLLEILENILHGVVLQLKEGERRVTKDLPSQVSENIIRGAEFISRNLVKGAEKTGEFISYSTPYLISKMKSAPPNAPPVSSNIQTTVNVAKSVTGTAASCAGYITRQVAVKTNALGRFLAPHIQRHGSSLLSKAFGLEEKEANEKMSAALTITASAVEGFSTVYSGLEESAGILGRKLSNNSVKIIEHKYGSSAGCLASETFDTVGNVINLSRNVSIVKPRSFVKQTAKGTGKAIIQELNANPRNSQNELNYIPASSLYPDLTALECRVKKS